MSLLDVNFEEFTVVNKTVVPDGVGGTTNAWMDGATIRGAMVFDDSKEMKIAKALGAKSVYTFTVRKNVLLDYYTVLRREGDGKIFRLTSNSDDMKTPRGAGLNIRQYSAEEWELTP